MCYGNKPHLNRQDICVIQENASQDLQCEVLNQPQFYQDGRGMLLAIAAEVTAERSCPCKRPACPAIGGGSEVTY
ncbi:hypothetical protein J6590_063117 [Homalodisca vitripennis]|nr:hypothetical protein J6590_063117 [Homalodisca vitripennis]